MNDEKIVITKDSLELALLSKYEHIKRTHNWMTPLGIFLTLFLSSILSDYKNIFYLPAETWKGVVWLGCLLSFIWLIISWKNDRNAPSVKDIIEIIINKSIKSDYTSVFIITHQFDDGIIKFLVSRNEAWNSYFLPHSYYLPSLAVNEQLQNMSIILLSLLGIKKDNSGICLEYISCDLVSMKLSMKHKEYKQFNFKFFKMKMEHINNIIKKNSLSFEADGINYCWKSINELGSDEGTTKNNGDVISHINRNVVIFHNNT